MDEIERIERRSRELDEKTERLERLLEELASGKAPAAPAKPRTQTLNYVKGWHPQEDGFRWAGDGAQHAAVHFDGPGVLFAEFFVPRFIAGEPVTISANGVELERFVPGREGIFRKSISVPAGSQHVQFTAGFWSPREHGVEDARTLSLAFRRIELK